MACPYRCRWQHFPLAWSGLVLEQGRHHLLFPGGPQGRTKASWTGVRCLVCPCKMSEHVGIGTRAQGLEGKVPSHRGVSRVQGRGTELEGTGPLSCPQSCHSSDSPHTLEVCPQAPSIPLSHEQSVFGEKTTRYTCSQRLTIPEGSRI